MRLLASAFVLTQLLCTPTLAQVCAQWSPGFHLRGATASAFTMGEVRAFVQHDDGSGQALYAGGAFVRMGPAPANRIARWNGQSWSPLGSGLSGTYDDVRALALFDDGSGTKLVAGGSFMTAGGVSADGVAAWNGSSWSALPIGQSSSIVALAVYDSGGGAGPQLYASGAINIPTPQPTRVARWTGTQWVPVLTSLPSSFHDIWALRVFDDGSGGGPRLYAGGSLSSFGGPPSGYVAKWDGSQWTPVNNVGLSKVYALEIFDDGGGASRLYAAGTPLAAHGHLVVQLDAGSWTPILDGSSFQVGEQMVALHAFDDGTGPALYAGGFLYPGGTGIRSILRWDGASWSQLGSGASNGVDGQVLALGTFSPGGSQSARLFVGGDFENAGDVGETNLAAWRSPSWSSVGAGQGLSARVDDLAVVHAGGVPTLIAGGEFLSAGGAVAHYVAAFDGRVWRALGSGGPASRPTCIEAYDDGGGEALFAGVDTITYGLMKWNGSSWSTVISTLNGRPTALVNYDDGGGNALVMAGPFSNLVPGCVGIGKWNGSTWTGLGSGVSSGVCWTMAVYNGDLYAGGSFGTAGGATIYDIARWNGSTWFPVGAATGTNGDVFALKVHDDGSGPALFACGAFTSIGGVSASKVARWNGSTWSPVGNPNFNDEPLALEVFDDGTGLKLFVGGFFTQTGGASARAIARWDGSSWGRVGTGLSTDSFANAVCRALKAFDGGSGSGPALFAAGEFAQAGDLPSASIARFSCDSLNGSPFCSGDNLDPQVTTPCPCANFGSLGHGCANSVHAGGALLASSGSIAADPSTGTDTIVLTCSDLPASVAAIFLKGNAQAAGGIAFGDGLRCADGVLIRLATKIGSGGVAQFPEAGNPSLSHRGQTPLGSGEIAYYQTYYRNASPGFCTSATFNVTNGLRIHW